MNCMPQMYCVNTGRINSVGDNGARKFDKCFMRETDFQNFRARYAVKVGGVRNIREWARAVSSEPVLADGLITPQGPYARTGGNGRAPGAVSLVRSECVVRSTQP
jgi:hypothetical protein